MSGILQDTLTRAGIPAVVEGGGSFFTRDEIRLSLDGQLVRIHYETAEGPSQSLEDLFDYGLLGLEEDVERFRQYPDYVMRFFILLPQGEYLNSTFRGVCYYEHESDSVVTEEAGEIL